MEQQVGSQKFNQLMRYQGQVKLSKDEAEKILTLIWPDAMKDSPDAVARAVLICMQYRLNPLMKHVYLLPFVNKKKSAELQRKVTEWAVAIGISANRLLARRQGPYSYIDNTPRLMTDAEQKQIRGKLDDKQIWAITKLRSIDGMEAQGYGYWIKDADVYGDDKGNTAEGMAMIRSERQALERLNPDSLPGDVIVVDDSYLSIGRQPIIDMEKIAPEKVQSIEHKSTVAPETEVKKEPTEPKSVTKARVPKTTKVEPPPTQVVEVKEPHTESSEPLQPSVDMDWLKETLKQIRWNDETTKSWLGVNLKVDNTGTLDEVIKRLDKEQLARFTKEIQNRAAQIPMV